MLAIFYWTNMMAYVSVPNDLSKIKTKVEFNLTKRQILCFGAAYVLLYHIHKNAE